VGFPLFFVFPLLARYPVWNCMGRSHSMDFYMTQWNKKSSIFFASMNDRLPMPSNPGNKLATKKKPPRLAVKKWSGGPF